MEHVIDRLRGHVAALASDECEGRAAGTQGGRKARGLVTGWLEETGLEPAGENGFLQPIPSIGGANALGRFPVPGEGRHILIGAHYDHLGLLGGEMYPGANDNASGVAVLLEVARGLAERRSELGRDVLVASFDAEEPPYFLEPEMGSIHFVSNPTVPLDSIELMVCLDLVGSPLGGPDIAEELRDLVVVSGAERAGLGALVDDTPTEGVTLRRIGADIVPPLSDHFAFHSAGIPTMFLTSGRNRYYHTPEDTPEKLDYPMMADLADALTDIVVRTSRREDPIVYRPDVVDRESSIATILDRSRGRPRPGRRQDARHHGSLRRRARVGVLRRPRVRSPRPRAEDRRVNPRLSLHPSVQQAVPRWVASPSSEKSVTGPVRAAHRRRRNGGSESVGGVS